MTRRHWRYGAVDALGRATEKRESVSPKFIDRVLRAFQYQPVREAEDIRTYVKIGSYPLTLPYRLDSVGPHYMEIIYARLLAESSEVSSAISQIAGDEPTWEAGDLSGS